MVLTFFEASLTSIFIDVGSINLTEIKTTKSTSNGSVLQPETNLALLNRSCFSILKLILRFNVPRALPKRFRSNPFVWNVFNFNTCSIHHAIRKTNSRYQREVRANAKVEWAVRHVFTLFNNFFKNSLYSEIKTNQTWYWDRNRRRIYNIIQSYIIILESPGYG